MLLPVQRKSQQMRVDLIQSFLAVVQSYSGLAVFWAALLFLVGLFAVRYNAAADAKRIEDSRKN